MNAIVENMVNSLTGNVPKAVLCVRNVDMLQEITERDDEESRLLKSRSNVLTTHSQANALNQSLLDATQGALSGTLSSAARNSLMGEGKEYLAMEVQYNPTSIRMQTTTGMQTDYSGGSMGNMSNSMIVQNNVPTSTTLSVQLVFDEVNIFDAFMVNNVGSPVGSAVQAAGYFVGKDHTVQPQIEGILSLLTMDVTRQVVFYWSKMSFRGELTGVQANYTMFNKSGDPIRGVVNLSIRQGEQPEIYDQDCWNRAYENMFVKGKANGADLFTKVTNNNVLNLNL